jgi:hypothetical protein
VPIFPGVSYKAWPLPRSCRAGFDWPLLGVNKTLEFSIMWSLEDSAAGNIQWWHRKLIGGSWSQTGLRKQTTGPPRNTLPVSMVP